MWSRKMYKPNIWSYKRKTKKIVKKYFRADLFSRTPSLRAVFGTNFRAISRNFHLLREIARKLVRAKISTIKVC